MQYVYFTVVDVVMASGSATQTVVSALLFWLTRSLATFDWFLCYATHVNNFS